MSDDRLLFTRTLRGLEPTPGPAEDWFRKIKVGSTVAIEKPKQPRNGQQLRFYWALIKVIYDNLPEGVVYKDTEDLSDALKIAVGHCRIIELPSGAIQRIPKSISYSKMEQDKFDSFLTAVVDMAIKHWLPGITQAEIRERAEQMLGLGFMAHAR